MCWVTRRLRSSFALALPPLRSNPNSYLPPPSPQALPQRRPQRDWEARRNLCLSTGGRGSYLALVGINVCAVVLKVLVRRLTGVGMEFVGEEEQEVALTLSLLLE